jgi:glycosyltransferase involved in cell wall biosynthesis
MRIFYINAYFDPKRYEGSRVHIEELIKNVSNLGHEVWSTAGSPSKYSIKLKKNPLSRLLQLRNMDVYYFRFIGKPLWLPFYIRVPWANFGVNKKIIWEMNATSDFALYTQSTKGNTSLFNLDQIISSQAKSVDLAICNTNSLAQYATDIGITNIKTISLGSDPNLFKPDGKSTQYVTKSSDRLNVIWSGNSNAPWHDFETISRAAWELRENESIKFYIIGSYPKGISFPDNVIFKGLLQYQEVPKFLRAMDVGIAIYKDETWSRYGVYSSPIKVFDYLACGLIVLATPIEQIKECIIHDKTGFLIPPNDHKTLVEKLRFISKHKENFNDLRKQGRKLIVDYYNWHRVAKETIEAISNF